ncbi:MAG TPA: signal peptidase II [Actinomycetota bacterium]|jgi:signal peptidase II|nr:signal peptidase II [Actinomycetota bacterium]
MPRPVARQLALYGTAAAVLAADQLSKYLVVRDLAGRPPLRLVGSLVELRYATNSGGAFSLLTGAPLFFALMAVVVIGGILYAGRRARGLPVQLALGLLLGGAVGNLLDRLLRGEVPLRGEVVDFIKIGWWPVFNLADSCIVVGGLLLALLLGRAERPAGSSAGDDLPGQPGGTARDGATEARSRPGAAPGE